MTITIQKQTKKILTGLVGGILLAGAIPSLVHAQPPAPQNTLSGYTWIDFNGNGIFDTGEAGIGGIVATLRYQAGNRVISSAVSDDQGKFVLNNYNTDTSKFMYIEYYYPGSNMTIGPKRVGGDNSKNSAANTPTIIVGGAIPYATRTDAFKQAGVGNYPNYGMSLIEDQLTKTYWVSIPQSVPKWEYSLFFPKWVDANNPGQLERVDIWMASYSYHPDLAVENTASGSQTFTLKAGSFVKLNVPGMPGGDDVLDGALTDVRIDTTLGTYDGNTDFGGTSGHTWYNYSAPTKNATSDDGNEFFPGINLRPYGLIYNDPLDLNYFKGSVGEHIELKGIALAESGTTGSGSVLNLVNTETGAGFFVTYYSNQPLPLLLTAFNAKEDKGTGLLQWKATSDGTPGEYFVVEYSIDGQNFSSIGQVPALNEKTGAQTYQFRHINPVSGRNFYRIRLSDAGNLPKNSHVASINIGNAAASAISVFPVPADANLTVEGVKNTENIEIFNVTGQQVTLHSATAGDRVVFQTSGLPNGIYFLKVNLGDGSTYTHRVLVQHR